MQENERPYKGVDSKQLKQMLRDALMEAAPMEAELRHRGYSVSVGFHAVDSFSGSSIWEDAVQKESIPYVNASKTEDL